MSLRLSPSGAARRMICPGSHQLLAHVEKKPQNIYALEGEAAHYAAMLMLKSLTPELKYTREVTSTEYVITSEMLTNAELYVNVIREILAQESLSPSNLYVEQKVEIPQIHHDCMGYVDAFCYSPLSNRIYILDYKNGFTPVSAVENWQLLEYALGVIYFLTMSGFKIENDCELNLIIVQPNDFSSRDAKKEWVLTVDKLVKTYYPLLVKNENLALQANAPCIPTPLCKQCDARGICPALHEATLGVLDYARGATLERIDNDFLSQELKLLKRSEKLLQARISGLEEEAFQRIKAGEKIAGFRLSEQSRAEQWIVDTQTVIETGKLFGVDLQKPTSVITPTQARKAGIPAGYLNFIAARPAVALKLIEHDEPTQN